ncbi:MAG: hypothetical protein IJM15_03180 [Erysipelotrichaceae bacterium]|nr:hypothetical protein [Erysipelotrichaceae bacterium]
MLKKSVLTLFALLLLSISNVFCEEPEKVRDPSYIATITGTSETEVGHLIISEFNVNGSHQLSNLHGVITYDRNSLILYRVVFNTELTGWKSNFDTSSAGKISFNLNFSSSSEGDVINDDMKMFTMIFIVHENLEDTVKIRSSGVYTRIEKTVTSENNVINMDEINAALENGETPPEPVYGDLTEKIDICYDDVSATVHIREPKSSNSYLKSATFTNGKITPSFSKLMTSYKVTIDASQKLEHSFVPEIDSSTVSVSDEVNSQIVVTVTAEDGSTNSYVFSIERTGGSSNPAGPNGNNTDPVDPGKPNTGRENNMKIQLILIGAIALAFIVIGGYFVYQGSHVFIYEEEK